MSAIRYSIALALKVTPDFVHKVSWVFRSRRLSQSWMARRLTDEAGNYSMDVEVITPENVSSEASVALASDLAAKGSAVQQTWSRSLSETFGIVASQGSHLISPRSFPTVMITDSTGVVWGSSKQATLATALDDESDNTALIVGVIGGILGAMLVLFFTLAGVVHFGMHRTLKFDC